MAYLPKAPVPKDLKERKGHGSEIGQGLSLTGGITLVTNAVRREMEVQLARVENKLAKADKEFEAIMVSEQTHWRVDYLKNPTPPPHVLVSSTPGNKTPKA